MPLLWCCQSITLSKLFRYSIKAGCISLNVLPCRLLTRYRPIQASDTGRWCMPRTLEDLAPALREDECRFPGTRSEKVRWGVWTVSSLGWCSGATGGSGLMFPPSSGLPSLLSLAGDTWSGTEGMLPWSAGLPSILVPRCPWSKSLPSSDRLPFVSVSSKLPEKSTMRLVGLAHCGRR